jgi:hypothetical protein
MNTFTIVLLVLAVIAVGVTIAGLLRPSRRGIDVNAKVRERHDGAALERGGPASSVRAFNGGGTPM